MANFSTSNVAVFPSTYRKEIPQGKFTSERNFVNILNSIIDIDSYILNNDNNILKVVIHGYYFEISNFIISSYTSSDLWLGIKVESGNYSLVNYSEKTTDLDSNSLFQGLIYQTTKPTDESTDYYKCYYLQVVSGGKLCTENTVRLTTDSIRYSLSSNLTDELDSKQYIISNGQGIDTLTNADPEKRVVKLTSAQWNKLEGLPSKGGSDGTKLFYFDSNGVAHNNDEIDIGSNAASSGSQIQSQGVYILNGVITAGQTVFASTENPSGGKKGDLWFKYSA